MPGMSTARLAKCFPVGISSMMSRVITCCWVTFLTSTTGDDPDTVIVSLTSPIRSSAFTVALNPVVSSIPSRLSAANPGSVKVTVYTPGRSSMIRYCPDSSETTLRTRSISAGLRASITTPGKTAPVVSRTAPAIELLVWAPAGKAESSAAPTTTHNRAFSTKPSSGSAGLSVHMT
jgi:hypothetical protein